jgi:hypothetical protein
MSYDSVIRLNGADGDRLSAGRNDRILFRV